MLLAMAAIAAAAFVLPAVASAADWKKNGVTISNPEVQWADNGAPLTTETSATLGGSFSFSGGVNCTTVNGKMTLEPGYGTGRLTEFTMSPGSCVTTGTLKALGCTKVTAVVGTLPRAYFAINNTRALKILNAQFTYSLEGGKFCPTEVTISGDIIATPDNSKSISTLTFSGEVSSTLGTKVTAGGTVTLSPAARYGIISTETVNLTGGISYSGGVSCNVTGGLVLEPGSKGSIYDMKWGSCGFSGTFAALGCTSVTSVTPENMPWAIENTGSKIQITNMNYTMHFAGSSFCPKEFILKGSPTATPDKTSAISSTNLEGWMKSNLGGSEYAISSTLNWSPAATYGL
jgi:hypothetical protein